jgi:hypothetical protein
MCSAVLLSFNFAHIPNFKPPLSILPNAKHLLWCLTDSGASLTVSNHPLPPPFARLQDASAFAASVAAAHAMCHAHESGHKTQTKESAYAKKLLVAALPPPNRPPPQMPSQHFVRQQLQAQQMDPSQSSSAARQPPPPPPVEGGPQGEGEFLCELCQRFFKSEHALTVHKSTSQYHKQDKRASVGAVQPQQPQTMGGWAGGGTLGVAGAWKK